MQYYLNSPTVELGPILCNSAVCFKFFIKSIYPFKSKLGCKSDGKLLTHAGEYATARAASAAGTIMVSFHLIIHVVMYDLMIKG